MRADDTDPAWWRDGIIYQVYVRSFADSDGDGVGDLSGIVAHLDHLEWLGADAVWLSPIHPSPNADWGYDVADYASVDPVLGDLGALERLVAEASARGIRVILDLVPNHTSDHHPWFLDARSSREAAHRDWYVWADPRPDGSAPNNWVSTFGGPAWTLDGRTGQYYLHNFLPEQPDLDWWNEEVRQAFDDVLRFWFDRGVAGFRIDVAHGIVKDRDLRDNPPVSEADHPRVRALGLRPVHNMNRPEVHDVYRRWRRIADSYEPGRVLIGETWIFDLQSLMRCYGTEADELHMVMNFPFVFSELGAEMRGVVGATEDALPPGAWPVWVASNHDVGRSATRWCRGDERKVRTALLVLLTLRGTPILYYGDEIGMPDVRVPRRRLRDPVGLRGWPEDPGRDGARTPMPWEGGPTAGFTRPGVEPWLPLGDPATINVADQLGDPASVLHLCRDLIALRRREPDLRSGAYAALEAPEGSWVFARGQETVVAVNTSEHVVEVPTGPATVLVATERSFAGRSTDERLVLEPWQGAVLRLRS